jgi:hypothetical protein
MTVAYIAYSQLSPTQKTKVDEVLSKHPDFKIWAANIKDKKLLGAIVFMRAATWPDFIRDDERFFDDVRDPGHPTPLCCGFAGMTDSMARHTNWHFIDLPFSTDGSDTVEPETTNALNKILEFENALGSSGAPQPVQAYELPWLLHLVGDIHQPLHCVTRFTSRHPKPLGDLGGNSFLLDLSGQKKKSHSFWDGSLETEEDPMFIMELGDEIMRDIKQEKPDKTKEQDWVNESATIAKYMIYILGSDEGKKDNNGKEILPIITQDYQRYANATARYRVAIAGYRLGDILKRTFPSTP